MQGTRVQFLGQEDRLEAGMATHSSILAWRIPWADKLTGGLTVHGVKRVRHGLATKERQTVACGLRVPSGLGAAGD